jgi:hypothetical protein
MNDMLCHFPGARKNGINTDYATGGDEIPHKSRLCRSVHFASDKPQYLRLFFNFVSINP